jgi:heme exporter protein B
LLRAFLAVLRRDLLQARRRLGESVTAVVFFALALSLFPFGVGASPDLLARIGAGIVWVLALLAGVLGLDRLWQSDHDDGTLELLLLAPVPLELLVVAKIAAHWLTGGLLLVLASPLLAALLSLPAPAFWALPLGLLLGTPSLALIGSIGAALLLGSRRGSTLAALLVLPLCIPVLIFGVAAVEGATIGIGGAAPFLILAALLMASLALAPFATAVALRLAVE